jgi:hypothetical protein
VQHLDKGIRAGLVPETIVVLPQALPVGSYVNSKDGKHPIEDVLVKDLISPGASSVAARRTAGPASVQSPKCL